MDGVIAIMALFFAMICTSVGVGAYEERNFSKSTFFYVLALVNIITFFSSIQS